MNHSFSLDRLLNHKLVVVSGKGGVGKTTISLALGLIAAERGKKTLIAEVNSEEQIAHLLERNPTDYRQSEILPKLWSVNIQTKKAFEEYVVLHIKFRSLYKAVFENRLVRYFIDATPGLSDLMCIGKIYELVKEYDLVIVDAPATGQSISLFEIPSIVSAAVKVGPLQTQADKVDVLLHDPERTCFTLVTLPEEMPVMEGIEMQKTLKDRLGLAVGPIFLNQYHEALFTGRERSELKDLKKKRFEPDTLWNAVDLQLNRTELSSHYEEMLQDACHENPLVRVPFLYSSRFGLNEIEAIASMIEEASA